MAYLQSFTFNPFQENTYIIFNENKDCWIIDPGMYDTNEMDHFEKFISDNQLIPKAIINTHTHIDHIFGVSALKEKYNIPFAIHNADAPVLDGAAGAAMLFGFQFKNTPTVDFNLNEDEGYNIGEEHLKIFLVPGHSPGSVAFYHEKENWVISGDTLFSGSIGRTDLPGGNHDQLIKSIHTQLLTLPDDVKVYSGHGPETTIGIERQNNPFLT